MNSAVKTGLYGWAFIILSLYGFYLAWTPLLFIWGGVLCFAAALAECEAGDEEPAE